MPTIQLLLMERHWLEPFELSRLLQQPLATKPHSTHYARLKTKDDIDVLPQTGTVRNKKHLLLSLEKSEHITDDDINPKAAGW